MIFSTVHFLNFFKKDLKALNFIIQNYNKLIIKVPLGEDDINFEKNSKSQTFTF